MTSQDIRLNLATLQRVFPESLVNWQTFQITFQIGVAI